MKPLTMSEEELHRLRVQYDAHEQPDHRTCNVCRLLAEIDALRARLVEVEQKALAYDLTHTGDWLTRAHAVAQRTPVTNAGRDVWHICVEQAERLAAVEPVARAAVAFTDHPDQPMGNKVDAAVSALPDSLRAELAKEA